MDTASRIDLPGLSDGVDGDNAVVVVDEGDGDVGEPGHGGVYCVLRQQYRVHAIRRICWYTVYMFVLILCFDSHIFLPHLSLKIFLSILSLLFFSLLLK